ncbi:MAG: Fe-S cluster assembly protein SufD [Candidatus Pelagibacter sp. TMED118]|mgnify:CR=1 FL=1|nr:MAG: Fe-S cluster assembly protein SufD [Candidatus Pelagibacter sp. TMED118]|tara:strand:+ start:830 stop:2077 length:1248 start_codon:yes stop_codon:yes gene_type:complete
MINKEINLNEIKDILNLNKEEIVVRGKSLLNFTKNGFPTKQHEDWKFIDLNKIISSKIPDLKFTNSFISEKINIDDIINLIPKDLLKNNYIISVNGIIESIEFNNEEKNKFEIIKKPDNLNFKTDTSLNSLNKALYLDYIKLLVKEDYKFKNPVIFINYTSPNIINTALNQRLDIVMEKNSSMSILDFNLNLSKNNFYNIYNNFILNEGSILKNYKVDLNHNSNLYYSKSNIKLYKNSISENFIFSSGSEFSKNEVECNLLENFSSAFINGVINLDNSKQHEIRSKINHLSENTKSYQLIKCALKDQSKAVYQGKIFVDSVAQKTDGYQLSKAILLNDGTEFNGKPELEIYADDVKCSHGSSSGNLEDNKIFYLMTRGLNVNQAKKMLLDGYFLEVVEKITDNNVKGIIKDLMQI